MIDREAERWLWTGESTECICSHHLEFHHTVADSTGICTMCADSNSFYHEFIARRQPLMKVSDPRSDLVRCVLCGELVQPHPLKLQEHDNWHTIQESFK